MPRGCRARRGRGLFPEHATPKPAHDQSHLAPLDVCNGHSVAFSGTRYDREGNALEHKLVEGGEGEELLIATPARLRESAGQSPPLGLSRT